MSEENNMYFIPILIKAFESEEPIGAMEEALLEINELGKHSEYSEGLEQFNKFLEIGIQSQENKGFELVDKVLIGIVSESIKLDPEERDEIIGKIKLNQNLMDRYTKISEEYNFSLPISLDIYKDAILISTQNISQREDELNISNIEPGNYSLQLSNGRILWESEIKSEDVTKVDGEYGLAAETEESDTKPTRTIELIKDDIQLFVYAGLEFGKFKIVIK